MYECGCLCMCMYALMSVQIHVYGKVRGEAVVTLGSRLPFGGGALSLTWNLSSPLIWLASKPRDLAAFAFAALDFAPMQGVFCKMCVWGLEPRPPCLPTRHFTLPTELSPRSQRQI